MKFEQPPPTQFIQTNTQTVYTITEQRTLARSHHKIKTGKYTHKHNQQDVGTAYHKKETFVYFQTTTEKRVKTEYALNNLFIDCLQFVL